MTDPEARLDLLRHLLENLSDYEIKALIRCGPMPLTPTLGQRLARWLAPPSHACLRCDHPVCAVI